MTIRYWVDDSCANGNLDGVPILLKMGGEAAGARWPCIRAIHDQIERSQLSLLTSFHGSRFQMKG